MSILETAKAILQNVPVIALKDLVAEVSLITGKTTASVRGTVSKDSIEGVYNTSFLKSIGKTYQEGIFTSAPTKPHQNYDCRIKQRVRTQIFKHIPKKRDPIVLTMASYAGHCVKHIQAMRSTANVINVEMCPVVLKTYKRKRLGTVDYLGTIEDFVSNNPTLPIDFAFIDTVGYLSKKSEDLYKQLNSDQNIKVIAITQQFMRNFRNNPQSEWRLLNDKKFGKYVDKPLAYMKRVMKNYDLVEEIVYRKENVQHAQTMRTFVFVRKE